MPFFWYASFPNSRIKPRPSTTKAVTVQITLADYTQPITEIVAADPNRTYVLVENFSDSVGVWYVYAETVLVDPTSVATFGSIDQLVKFGNQLYQKQDDGTTTNWITVNIEDVGEFISPRQTANLDSPGTIWAAADSNVPVVPAVEVGIDRGSG